MCFSSFTFLFFSFCVLFDIIYGIEIPLCGHISTSQKVPTLMNISVSEFSPCVGKKRKDHQLCGPTALHYSSHPPLPGGTSNFSIPTWIFLLLLGGTHIYFLTYTSWYNNNIMSEIYRHNSPGRPRWILLRRSIFRPLGGRYVCVEEEVEGGNRFLFMKPPLSSLHLLK
jgi:hypothetical protein